MKEKKSRSIGDILNSEKVEEKLSEHIQNKNELQKAWKKTAGCSAHTKDIELKDGILLVTMDSSAWHQELIMRDLDGLAEQMSRETGRPVGRIRIQTGGYKSI